MSRQSYTDFAVGSRTSELVASWGELKADNTPLTEIAAHRRQASALVDELRFDEGPQNQRRSRPPVPPLH